ncbi:MAG: (Fe-S)-binding protein [Actinomycetales bacterium]
MSPSSQDPSAGTARLARWNGGSVAVFATCLNDTLFPGVAEDTVALLRRLGLRVVVPPAQTCCGQMHVNSGYPREAAGIVRSFVDAFESADLAVVVAPSASCVASVRHQQGLVARAVGDAGLERAVGDVAPRVRELTEFLVDDLGLEDVGAYFPHPVAYHPTCHSLRMLRVGDRPLRLLRGVDGIELRELERAQECCGFGGTFSVKNADTSVAMGRDKVANVVASGADVLVAADSSCLMHLGGLMSRQQLAVRPVHLATVLASTRQRPWPGPAVATPGPTAIAGRTSS